MLSVLKKRADRNKRQLSIDEACSVAKKQRAAKSVRAKRRTDDGWVDIEPNSYKWIPKTLDFPTPGARLSNIKRMDSISDIFLKLLPPSVLVAVRKEVGCETLKNSSLDDIYKMYAANIYLRAAAPLVDEGTEKNVFNSVYKSACGELGGQGCLGINKMVFLRNRFKISPSIARDKLSKSFCRAICLGEFVSLDEKQKKWRGRSPYIKKVLAKKNDPIGHWNTQVCVNLNSTSEPFIIGLYPFAGELECGQPLERRTEIWDWLISLLEYKEQPKMLPVICADSFYLDNSARDMLNARSIMYHCSIKKNWFQNITAHLEAQVKDMGKWSAAENTKTGEVAVFTWSGEQDIGKKFLLSTMMKKQSGKQDAKDPPGWDAYKLMFCGCDKYNTQIGKFVWPYRLPHWTAHFDDIFQVHVVLNTVAIWRENNSNDDCSTTKELMITLAKELHERCVQKRLPASQW